MGKELENNNNNNEMKDHLFGTVFSNFNMGRGGVDSLIKIYIALQLSKTKWVCNTNNDQ